MPLLKLRLGESRIVHARPVTRTGERASMDGALTWDTDGVAEGLTVEPQGDGFAAKVTRTGGADGNSCNVRASGDADLSEGRRLIIGLQPTFFQGDEAIGFDMTFDEPSDTPVEPATPGDTTADTSGQTVTNG